MKDDQELGELFVDKGGNLCKNFDCIEAMVSGFFTTANGHIAYELVKKPNYID